MWLEVDLNWHRSRAKHSLSRSKCSLHLDLNIADNRSKQNLDIDLNVAYFLAVFRSQLCLDIDLCHI